jgi:hypothetical protein
MIRLAIPLIATAIAVFLYFRRPMAYVSFTMWVWFLIPLVRRLIDWRIGWAEPNLTLLAPFFVASVGALTVIAPTKRRPLHILPTFVLCGMAIFYGFLMGIITNPSAESAYGLLNWGAPVIFALHLALSSQEYPELRRCVERTFAAGVGFMGLYGLFQFFTAPKWDVFWLEQISSGLIDPSFGQPEPFKIRVWSSMNGPGPFANVMMAGLVLLLVSRVPLKLPASALGYVSFLLTVVRSAWLEYLVGVVLLMRGERPTRILRLVATFGVLGLCLVPVLQNPDVAPLLGDRLKSFTNLHQDESFRERSDMYRIVTGIIREDPFGHGLRNQEIDRNLVVDSGVLILLLQLGWIGAALYSIGILAFFLMPMTKGRIAIDAVKGRRVPKDISADGSPITILPADRQFEDDRLPNALKAVCIAYAAQLIGGMIFVGSTGAIFWLCLGLAVCANRWHQAQVDLPEPVSRGAYVRPKPARRLL